MKKLILMLALALGVISCDTGNNCKSYIPLSEFEEFTIGASGNYVLIKDLLDSEDSFSYYNDRIFIVVYNNTGVRYSISLEDDYGCVSIVNCSVDNRKVEYDYFKIRLLKAYNYDTN